MQVLYPKQQYEVFSNDRSMFPRRNFPTSISEMISQMGLDFPQPPSATGNLTSPGISWEEKWGGGGWAAAGTEARGALQLLPQSLPSKGQQSETQQGTGSPQVHFRKALFSFLFF